MMTPFERFKVRKFAQDIASGKFAFDPGGMITAGAAAFVAADVVDLARELVRLDSMRETWECIDCGRNWCGPSHEPCRDRVGETCRSIP